MDNNRQLTISIPAFTVAVPLIGRAATDPTTVAAFIDIVVTFIKGLVVANGYELDDEDRAKAVFDREWGAYVAQRLAIKPPRWPSEQEHVYYTAMKHAEFAMALADERNVTRITESIFEKAGWKASGVCHGYHIQPYVQTGSCASNQLLGCWCNICQ